MQRITKKTFKFFFSQIFVKFVHCVLHQFHPILTIASYLEPPKTFIHSTILRPSMIFSVILVAALAFHSNSFSFITTHLHPQNTSTRPPSFLFSSTPSTRLSDPQRMQCSRTKGRTSCAICLRGGWGWGGSTGWSTRK